MDDSYIGMLDLVYDVEHWSLAVTLCVLILAGQALRAVGREPGPSPYIQRLSDSFLMASGLWGAYLVVSTVLFLLKFWKGLLNDAGPILVFMTLVALAAGLWLAGVGISRAVTHFRSGGDATQRRVQARRATWVAMSLTAAWFVYCCLVFSAMYAYVYLSTLGLLLLGFYGTSDAFRKLLKGQKQDTHVLVHIVGALSASLGLFAFIDVFYRAAFGESWTIVIRQLLTSISFGGIGVLLLYRRWRVVQLVLSLMAICVVVWRVSYCVNKVPELSRSMDRLVKATMKSGCGRYGHMIYYGSPDDNALLWKSIDLAVVDLDLFRTEDLDCESIPIDLKVTIDGVILDKDTISLEGNPKIISNPEFMKALKSGVAYGLALAVDNTVPWKSVVSLAETARRNGNHRVLFLFLKKRSNCCFDYDLPKHRLTARVEEILRREDVYPGEEMIYCARILDRIDTFCPHVQRELASTCYCDMFEKVEMLAHDLPWAALGCFGDVDIEAMDLLIRCFFTFDSFHLVNVPIVGPDAPWSQTVSLPADMPWSLAHKHILNATSKAREPIPPLRLLVGEPSNDSTEK
jgi:hypothetical protein